MCNFTILIDGKRFWPCILCYAHIKSAVLEEMIGPTIMDIANRIIREDEPPDFTLRIGVVT
jgi:hypothetical protein